MNQKISWPSHSKKKGPTIDAVLIKWIKNGRDAGQPVDDFQIMNRSVLIHT